MWRIRRNSVMPKGNQKEKTVWVDCAYWTDRTAIAPYLKKGTQVYAEGTPDLRTYQKTDGTQGVSLTLRVLSVQLLGSRNSDEQVEMTVTMPDLPELCRLYLHPEK